MISVFRRMFKIGQAEAHAALDQVEDPVKMIEQGLRDLRKDLEESMQSLAGVKAMVIGARREIDQQREVAADYERKAMLLLQRAEQGELDPAEAERLALDALSRKETAVQQAGELSGQLQSHEKGAEQLEANVRKLRSQIGSWENELRTLKARARVGKATEKLNRQLARVDSSGTVAMLARMREKVNQQESLARAYGEMAAVETSVDAEIDRALGGGASASTGAAASLAELKAKMGMK